MVSFVVGIIIVLLWRAATSEKCYLQSSCGDNQGTAVHSTECKGTVGKNIELACLYSNNVSSLNLTYNWVKDHKILNSTSEIIEFKPFEYTDAGHYQCTAFSDDRKMYCGQIALVTAPYPPASCVEEGDADYNCSCRQYFKYTNHCEVLVTIDVGGYPTPSITWIVNDTVASNDNQAVLNILDNGSALIDVQLWPSYWDDVSAIAQNDISYAGICLHHSSQDYPNLPGPMISFNLSLTPIQLTEGVRNATVISCSSNSYVGNFSICHSKNLTNLQRLAVDDEDCCFCSPSGDCDEKFPNWKLDIELTVVGEKDQFNCLIKLMNVAEDDSGFYQCRVYHLENYPCQRRYGSIYNFSVSKQDSSPSTIAHHDYLTVFAIATSTPSIIIFIVTLVPLALFLYWKHKRSQSTLGMEQTYEDTRVQENRRPLLLYKNGSQIRNQGIGCCHNQKVHVMHFDSEESRQWIDNYLTDILRRMNVQQEFTIAGQLHLSEIHRMIKENYKVIVVISKDVAATKCETLLNQIIFKQDCRKPCLITILFNCTRGDLCEGIESLVVRCVLLHHNERNLYDRLKQAICDQCR